MIRNSTLLIVFLFCCQFAKASHIVGGDFTYRWIGGNNFELKLKIYRDCYNSQTPFDNTITIGIFDKVTNVSSGTLVMTKQDSSIVTLSGTAACALPADICVLEGTYLDTISLPNNPHGYYIVWERCCRNISVVNINNAFDTGMVFYMEMPDPAFHNSSPAFVNDPLPFICEGQPLSYSFAAADVNGDQLVYELATPLAGNTGYPTTYNITPILPVPLPAPYTPILWAQGFNLANVCGSSSNPMAVDPVTGMLTVTADYAGVYGAAVVIHEFRNGIEIGMVRREIEFAVIVCPNAAPLLNIASALSFSNNTFTIYETDSICFTANATDPTDSVYMHYSGDIFSGGIISPPFATANSDSGLNAAHSYFCWKTQCGQADTVSYNVVYSLSDNGCPFPVIVIDSLKILVKPSPLINSLDLLCITLKDNSATEVFWRNPVLIPSKYFNRFEILRSMNGSPFTLLATIADQSALSYKDSSAIDCMANDYCYFIRGINNCGVAGLTSDTLCTISEINLKTNYMKQVSVTDTNKIEIQWKHFPDGPYSTFQIYRKENSAGADYSLYKTLVHPGYDSWTDEQVFTSSKSYCYYLVNEDYCGNISPMSNEACTILLNGKSGAGENDLSWNYYSTWNGGVQKYEVYRKPVSGTIYSAVTELPGINNSCRDFDLDLHYGQYNYYVKAIENAGSLNGESLSNEITLHQPPNGFLPGAFTPNDDGVNDLWGVTSSFVNTFDLKVFSRWGELVFATASKNDLWDGSFNSKKALQGIYVYTLRYRGFENNNISVKTGFVTLLR
ncbi:MAG: gliding motility-associated C-terminal domain-containing protein [Bacteroidia bacterium]